MSGQVSIISNTVSDPAFNPLSAVRLFEDFAIENMGANTQAGAFWQATGNAGGGYLSTATTSQPQANRIGIIGVGIGTTSNSTGNGVITGDLCSVYAGNGEVTLQWAAQMPATLSTGTNEYVVEMGFGNTVSGAVSTNAAVIQYLRTTSTNFSAYTANNSTVTTVTTSDAADFVVTAGAWYNFKIYMHADGSAIDFYVGPAGSPLVLLGTSTTNLPSLTHPTNLMFNIYKAATFAVQRILTLDWIQFDIKQLNR